MIYVVENDISVRRSFEIFLESAGFEFKSFGTAESLLSNSIPSSNDLFLLDIDLPLRNGLDLLHKFAQEKRNIPAIVITTIDSAQTRESCKRYGVKAILRKPVDSEALLDLINYHIQ